jgi:hypothetical protein
MARELQENILHCSAAMADESHNQRPVKLSASQFCC